ncbi:MAG: transglutaminase domain-containing protein [Lachnospiraceae bacterium]|nr:transglutaminase domain-containing protein [Lachnospiraceae bacterium]
MKKGIDRLLLTAGCLFLALAVVLLVKGTAESYEKVCAPEAYGSVRSESSYGNGIESALIRGGSTLIYIADSFVYAYNTCGYYDSRISYLGRGPAGSGGYGTEGQGKYGQTARGEGLSDMQCGCILLYLLIVLLLSVPVMIGGFTVHIYILTGGVLASILLLGKVPEYKYLVMLAGGWLYVHLIKSWINMSRGSERFCEFPVRLLPGYGFVLLIFLSVLCLLPSERLPQVNKEAKEIIFSQLQKIQLVSDQYEENQSYQVLENQKQEEENDWADDEEEEGTEAVWQANEEENTEDNIEENISENTEKREEADRTNSGMDGRNDESSELNEEENLGPGKGASGGGVSGGRTDRTGNLTFRGKTVMTAVMETKPETNLYIRLFYAENYEDNRWTASDKEQFADADKTAREHTMPVFYSLKDGRGDGNIVNAALNLTYTQKQSSDFSLGSSYAAEGYFPEQDEYIYSVCREVPENLRQLFEEQFGELSGGIFTQETGNPVEEDRIRKIENVLDDLAYYTLSPGSVPADEDFITWFLTKNKRGYCMHFASAGVMMLRAAGISARYAEGYFVPLAAWEEQADGKWCAQILDSNAHAWAEVYRTEGLSKSRVENVYDTGCWTPVELTPSYSGELSGSFAGQQDAYVGRVAIPGIVIFMIKGILCLSGIALLTAAGVFTYRKCVDIHEYRMTHTGDNRRDIKNMMKLLMKKMVRRNRSVRRIFRADQMTREELVQYASVLFQKSGQDDKGAEYFNRFSNYVYKAAFGSEISDREKKEAQFLYGKLIALCRTDPEKKFE